MQLVMGWVIEPQHLFEAEDNLKNRQPGKHLGMGTIRIAALLAP